MSNKIIGIDLGTTNSCVSVFEGNATTVIPNAEGRNTTPSVIGFTKDGERKVGDAAKRQAVTNPKGTVYSIKRFMGMSYDKLDKEISRVPYKVVNEKGQPRVSIDVTGKEEKFSPEQISAMILQKMKKTAEDYLGSEVTDAVITVPAYFNDSQRQATKQAGEIAGLNVRRIVNEPTAAALAFGLDKLEKDMKIVVFDCGGGTHDISILELGSGVFEVLATDGDTHLGGDDFDQVLIDWLADEFKADTTIDLRKDPMAMQRLKEAAEKAKIELSSSEATDINLPYITVLDGVPQHLVKNLTRAKFNQLTSSLVDRCIAPCKSALESAELTVNDIDEILLVGGSTRIPAIQEAVKKFFGKEPSKGVNPDEAVAEGAAIQGAVIAGESGVGDVVLLDVTPLNLGIETLGEVMTTVIDANTTIPTHKAQTFSTAVDNQPGVQIHILQGNRPMAKDNKSLGMFNLEGIAPAPKGVPQIEVSFDIDANGILSVTAKDLGTGKDQKLTITDSGTLSKEDIEKMKADAEANKEADAKRLETIQKINAAESYSFNVANALKDYADKFTDDEKKEVEDLKDKLDEALKDRENVDAIEAAREALDKVWAPKIQKVYEEAAKAAQAQQAADGTANAGAETQSNPFADGNMKDVGDMFKNAGADFTETK